MQNFKMSLLGYNNLLKKLKDLNKRADKLGVEHVFPEVVRMYTDIITEDGSVDGVVEVRQMVEFTLEGNKPVVNGYRVIAVLENVKGENIVRFLVGEEDEAHNVYKYRRRVDCDHCNHNRQRKHTYILQEEITGRYLQVGRTCLKDFLQGDITYLVRYAEIDIDKIEEEAVARGEVAEPTYIGIEDFVAVTIEHVNTYGYTPTRNFGSTCNSVWNDFYTPIGSKGKFPIVETIAKNRGEAQEIIEWAKLNGESENTYLYNLSVIAKDGLVPSSRRGLAASMVVAYHKSKQGDVEPVKRSEYVGTVGEKIQTSATVEKVLTFEGSYGEVDMILFKDDEGNILKWTTSTDHKMEEGQLRRIVGKVKDHSEYHGTKQTTLIRVR